MVRCIMLATMNDEFSHRFENAQPKEMIQVLNKSFGIPNNVERHKKSYAVPTLVGEGTKSLKKLTSIREGIKKVPKCKPRSERAQRA